MNNTPLYTYRDGYMDLSSSIGKMRPNWLAGALRCLLATSTPMPSVRVDLLRYFVNRALSVFSWRRLSS